MWVGAPFRASGRILGEFRMVEVNFCLMEDCLWSGRPVKSARVHPPAHIRPAYPPPHAMRDGRAYPEGVARSNDEVAALLREYADLISITGSDTFKARVYEKAARSVGGHHADVSTLDLQGLQEIPNVGKSIAQKVLEYFDSGSVSAVEELRAKIPAGVRRLTAIPTLGPKKALTVYEELGISSVEELADAIHEERLRDLKGFGPRTEENILHGIELLQSAGNRVQLDVASDLADAVVAALSQVLCPEHERELVVGTASGNGAVRKMKDLWPFEVALRGETSNRLMLRWVEDRRSER
jgi:ERCC4-type nuclease